MNFTSNAEWPNEGETEGVGITTDAHQTWAQAKEVCKKLRENGYGGDKTIFPIRTWVGDEKGNPLVKES